MAVKDTGGQPLSGASAAAAALYREAVDAYHCFAGEPFPALTAATADSPDFIMAHVLKAYLTLLGGNRRTRAIGDAALAAARDLPATPHEAGHRAAAEAMAAGEIRRAGRILEDLSLADPFDTLALQVGQQADFHTGDARMLRDRIARVRPAWTPDRPNYHAILGMHAFGLEETGFYRRAEDAGREAVALQPRNGWARHAVAHVLEMEDRRADGLAWMLPDAEVWSRQSFFAVHNWWHTALFHLGLGQYGEVLDLYDRRIRGERSSLSFDLDDAAAMLWRLRLLDVDVGGRWDELADAWLAFPRGASAFDDMHALLAFLGAGRPSEADATLDALRAACDGRGDNARASRDVGLPVAEALLAFERGDFAAAADGLRDARNGAAAFGGSHAQRDLLDLTLIAAARRDGQGTLERALLAERAAAAPLSVG